jgi:hypothetical protein
MHRCPKWVLPLRLSGQNFVCSYGFRHTLRSPRIYSLFYQCNSIRCRADTVELMIMYTYPLCYFVSVTSTLLSRPDSFSGTIATVCLPHRLRNRVPHLYKTEGKFVVFYILVSKCTTAWESLALLLFINFHFFPPAFLCSLTCYRAILRGRCLTPSHTNNTHK